MATSDQRMQGPSPAYYSSEVSSIKDFHSTPNNMRSAPRGSHGIVIDSPLRIYKKDWPQISTKQDDPEVYTGSMFSESAIYKKTAAEMLSTFILVFAGCGAIMVNADQDNVLTHIGVAATFGLAVMAMLYTVGHISGGHMNPAVSIAFSSIGQLPLKELPMYIVAQLGGATLAAAALRYLIGDVANVASNFPGERPLNSLVVEFIVTFILMFVLSAMVTDPKSVGNMVGIAVGGTITLNALFAGPISGASMNPARSVGPAVISGKYDGLWIFIFGPIFGALCGAWAYRAIKLQH